MTIFLYIFIFILIVFLMKLLNNRYLTVTLICSALIIIFVLKPSVCINGTISGVTLFFYKVFPSLFPFLVMCNIILQYNGIYIYSKIFGKCICKPLGLPVECSLVIIISILCGYPLGAKYSCDLYENKVIDYDTCERLLNIASNASPLFVIASVGTSMLTNTFLGYILLISNYLSCFLISFILPNRKHKFSIKSSSFKSKLSPKIPFGLALKKSINNSITSCISVGGFITLFSIINNIIKNSIVFNTILDKFTLLFKVPQKILEGTFLGTIEMTNGCNIISNCNINMVVKVVFISFLLGFSGLSIIWQCNSFMSKHNFSLSKYIKFKFIQGLLCSLISYSLYKILFPIKSISVINFTPLINININLILALIFIIILIPFLLYNILFFIHTS